jgi:casein kinase 1
LDVKPANILGPDPSAARAVAGCASAQWTLVDFGLARRWCDQQTGEHTPDVRRRGVVGTGRYASLANHSGEPLGRRDDLESLALTLAFLHEGRLPWSAHDSALPAPTKPERFALMLAEKQRACVDEIAGTLPSHFREYLRAVRLLRYDERPNYGVLRALLSLGG